MSTWKVQDYLSNPRIEHFQNAPTLVINIVISILSTKYFVDQMSVGQMVFDQLTWNLSYTNIDVNLKYFDKNYRNNVKFYDEKVLYF